MAIWVIDAIDKQVPGYQAIIQESATVIREWLQKRLIEIGKEEEVIIAFENFLSTIPEMLEDNAYNSRVVEGGWDIFPGFNYRVSGDSSINIGLGMPDSVKDALRKGLLLDGRRLWAKVGSLPFKVTSLSGEPIVDMTFTPMSATVDNEYDGSRITLYDDWISS